ncbi:MAG: hypothetical protein V9F00_01665 [Nocardioides sp.]
MASPASTTIYTYDVHRLSAGSTYITPEPGPPAVDCKTTAYDADGFRSLGASVCPRRTAAIWRYSTYDRPAQVVQRDSCSGATRTASGGRVAEVRVVPGMRCATEAGASALPRLTGSIAESFEGGVYARRTFKAGSMFYRAEGWGASAPGRFLGTEAVSTRAEAGAADNIAKWGNPTQVMRTYRLTEDVTMYYGRVAGGEGYQALVPRGVDLGTVLRQVGARPLG